MNWQVSRGGGWSRANPPPIEAAKRGWGHPWQPGDDGNVSRKHHRTTKPVPGWLQFCKPSKDKQKNGGNIHWRLKVQFLVFQFPCICGQTVRHPPHFELSEKHPLKIPPNMGFTWYKASYGLVHKQSKYGYTKL